MMNPRTLFLLSLALGGCASHPDAATTPLIVHDHVQAAYDNYQSNMQKSRPPVTFDSGRSATNCKQYFDEKESSAVSEGTSNFLAAQDYVICDTIRAIRESARSELPADATDDISADLLNRLDLQSFRSSFFQRTDENQRTLNTVVPGQITTTPYSVQPTIEDWLYKVHVVALVDADNNGEQDWVVWVTDKSGSGSYDTLRAYLAYNVDQEGLIELTEL